MLRLPLFNDSRYRFRYCSTRVNYAQLLMVDGWRIFAVIALSTLMVLGATAWVVDKVYRFEISRQKHD